jgi:DNA-binding HxlR family transcriptional regulator
MSGGYGQFCPVAMASEILAKRWTLVLLREFVAGSTRFNELRRGVPRMSPTLLSRRLKELEAAGILHRVADAAGPGPDEYGLTEAGLALAPVIEAIGTWGQAWVATDVSLANPDPALLMWDMRRNLDPDPMPDGRKVVRFGYPDQPASSRDWWLIVEPDGGVDLCASEPGFDVDLYVTSDLRVMVSIWMGLSTVSREIDAGRLHLDGPAPMRNRMQAWLGLSHFAGLPKRGAASVRP